MKPKRMHLFTIIQLSIFVLLYAVISIQKVAIIFPIIIALCIPFRMYLLPKIFTEEELVMIDGEDFQIQKWLRRHDDAGGSTVMDDEKKDEVPCVTQDMSEGSVIVGEHENEPYHDSEA